MSEFVYLYRGGERPDSPQQAEQRMQKWVAWMKELGEKGHIKDRGQPLEQTGKVVRANGSQKVSWAVSVAATSPMAPRYQAISWRTR